MDHIFDPLDAEIILRSCDGIDFGVHGNILRLISPLFEDVLASTQQLPSSSPFIQMTEDSNSLRLLLAFSYPRTVCEEPDLHTMLDIKRTAILARRYDLKFLHTKVEQALLRYSTVSPAATFAVSWKYSYHDAARAAARCSLDEPDFFKSIAYSDEIPEFGEIPATAVLLLYRYHTSVRGQLEHVLQLNSLEHPITWISPNHIGASLQNGAEPTCTCNMAVVWFRQPDTGGVSEWRVYSWWWEYVFAVVLSLQSERRPCVEAALDDSMPHCLRMASRCNICDNGAALAARVLYATRQALLRKIEELLGAIPLSLPCDIGLHSAVDTLMPLTNLA
ncbi:unnamed protein product [Peniophora sp. CBMAI 1063]|nr:unnamed protein product [Peniophora sp. CBMAI 1063]